MIPSEHISEVELAGFRAGRLDGARTVEIAGHLEVCAGCAGRFLGLEAPAWSGLPLDGSLIADHARFEDLIDYLDGGLDDREVIEAHLAICDSCAGDLNSLRVSRIETATEKRYFRSRALTRLANLRWQGWWLWPATALLVLIALGWWLHEDREPPIVRREPVPEKDINKDMVPEPSPELLIAIADGGRTVGLDSGGRLVGLDGLPEDLAGDLARVLKGEAIRPNRLLKDLVSGDVEVRGDPETPSRVRLISPVGTLVRDSRPRFRWAAIEGASGYSVTVTDDRFNVIAESGRIVATQWRPETALERGRVYQWQVTAEGVPINDGPRSLGIFRVIGAEELASIRKVEAGTDSSLARAVLYARAGLVDEARRELSGLGAVNKSSLDRVRRSILSVR